MTSNDGRHEILTCEHCGRDLPARVFELHMQKQHGVTNAFRLLSRRGTRLDGPHRCTFCGKTRKPVWRYSRSTRGEAHLCSLCKDGVFDRSFGSVDAFIFTKTGGGFETDRSRY